MDIQVRQILQSIKVTILKRGWTQGSLVSKTGVCLFGAVTCQGTIPVKRTIENEDEFSIKGRDKGEEPTSYNLSFFAPAGKAFILLAYQAGVMLSDLAVWQDDPDRTQEEVIKLIDDTLEADHDPDDIYKYVVTEEFARLAEEDRQKSLSRMQVRSEIKW